MAIRTPTSGLSKPLTVISLLFLAACSPGPDQSFQLAHQGLLCGDISSDGRFAVIGSIHHGGSYWNLDKQERLFNWNHQAEGFSTLRACALSGDGRYAVTTEEKNLVLWNTQTGKPEQFWATSDRILDIALNQDGTRALIGLRNGEVSYFDVRRGGALHTFEHAAEVRSVSLSADGSIGLSAGDDMQAKAWDLRTGKPRASQTLRNQIKIAQLSHSGELAFIASQREQMLTWKTHSGDHLFNQPTRYTNFSAASFANDETKLITGSFTGIVTQWQLPSGSEIQHWKAAPRQAYGGNASSAIIDLVDLGPSVVALTADGMFERFIPR
jgi:WD40 repeat protein